MRQFITRLAVVLSAIVVTVIAAEVVLRVSPLRRLLWAPPRGYHRADAERGYDIIENAPRQLQRFADAEVEIWANDLGCFDDPFVPGPASVRSPDADPAPVLLLGDSFTFGYAPYAEKWGTILERSIGRRVVKCGVSGYGTRQERLKAAHLLERGVRPSLVVVGYFWNDFVDDVLFPEETVRAGYRVTSVAFDDVASGTTKRVVPKGIESVNYALRLHSITYNLVRLARARLREEGDAGIDLAMHPEALFSAPWPWVASAFERHMAELRGFRDLAQGVGAPLVVVLIPAKEEMADERVGEFGAARAAVMRFLARESIASIDLKPLLAPFAEPPGGDESGRGLYWPVDAHWNRRGNRLAGLLVARELMKMSLVGASDPTRLGLERALAFEHGRPNAMPPTVP